MDQAATRNNTSALPAGVVPAEIPRRATAELVEPQVRAEPAIPFWNKALLFLTLFTTTSAGAMMAGYDVSFSHPFSSFLALFRGLSFSIPLMLILGSHEMGHYLTARAHRVDTSFPYFIPVPFFIGTMGAFIRLKAPARTRNAMFDIGAAGPWAGVIVAIPCIVLGLYLSDVAPLDQTAGGLQLGNSLLFMWLSKLVLGVDPDSVSIGLHPIAFAGWIGLFVTMLNLLPISQTDGGHVTYTLFPKHHRTIGKLFLVACVLMSLFPMAVGEAPWFGWLVFAGFISLVLGLGHPPTIDQDSPLDPRRRIAAWATVGLFIVTFSPVPFSFQEPSQQPPAAGRTIEVRENLAPLVGPQGAPSRVLSIDFTANQGIANG